MDEQNVMYIYTVEYYSAIKSNNILIHATAWMENMYVKEAHHKKQHIVKYDRLQEANL